MDENKQVDYDHCKILVDDEWKDKESLEDEVEDLVKKKEYGKVAKYANALEAFDARVPEIRKAMRPDDIAMVVADHGVDPTTKSTDHSREYIPLLVFGNPVKPDTDLGIRGTFADAGATVAEIFGIQAPVIGHSFLKEISY